MSSYLCLFLNIAMNSEAPVQINTDSVLVLLWLKYDFMIMIWETGTKFKCDCLDILYSNYHRPVTRKAAVLAPALICLPKDTEWQ